MFFDVLLGAHNILAEETGRLEIRATEIHVHPSWNPMRISGDLALIKLPQTVDITESTAVLENPEIIELTVTIVLLRKRTADLLAKYF